MLSCNNLGDDYQLGIQGKLALSISGAGGVSYFFSFPGKLRKSIADKVQERRRFKIYENDKKFVHP